MSLSEGKADQLCAALKDIPPRLRTRDIPKRIATKADIPASDLREIVRVLVSLYSAREEEEASVEEFVDALLSAMQESGDEKLTKLKASKKEQKVRLNAFLSLDNSLGITAKGLSVAYENPRHYHSARILTDARPVFTIDPSQKPTAFVILHTLRFNVHEGGEDKEWFVALNSIDLEQLKHVIDRAIKKEKSLSEAIKKTESTLLRWEK